MTWLELNPFPPAEGATIFDITSMWRGEKCRTAVIGEARLHWTMNQWSAHGHDDIRFRQRGTPKPQRKRNSQRGAVNRPRSFV